VHFSNTSRLFTRLGWAVFTGMTKTTGIIEQLKSTGPNSQCVYDTGQPVVDPNLLFTLLIFFIVSSPDILHDQKHMRATVTVIRKKKSNTPERTI